MWLIREVENVESAEFFDFLEDYTSQSDFDLVIIFFATNRLKVYKSDNDAK